MSNPIPAASLLCAAALFSSSCAVNTASKRDTSNVLEISVPEQKMALYHEGTLVKTYPVSTSKYGLGDKKGSYRTPIGEMEIAQKIGGDKPAGAVFKSRKWTGEIVEPDSPGRDPIVSRILWLKGLENKNSNTYSRCIYIHGTAAEKEIGHPVSYGCIRMKSEDVIDLYERVGEGSKVFVTRRPLKLPKADSEEEKTAPATIEPGPLEEVEEIRLASAGIPARHSARSPRSKPSVSVAPLHDTAPAASPMLPTINAPAAFRTSASTSSEENLPSEATASAGEVPREITPASLEETPIRRDFRPISTRSAPPSGTPVTVSYLSP